MVLSVLKSLTSLLTTLLQLILGIYLAVILRTRVVYQLIFDEARYRQVGYQPYTTIVSGITVLLYTEALDKNQHNHESKGDSLKLILHSRHVFFLLRPNFLFENCFINVRNCLN